MADTNDREAIKQIRTNNLKSVARKFGSTSALAKRLGRSPSQISDMLSGAKSFGPKIARYIEVTLGLPELSLDQEKANVEIIPQKVLNVTRVPLISSVHAGDPTYSGDPTFDEYVDVYTEVPKGSWAMEVDGDSMEPEFREGEIVVIDPSRSPRAGDFVVARSELGILSGSTLKKYIVTGIDRYGRETFDLKPLNPIYPTLHSEEHQLYIVGVVVESHRTY